MRPFLDANILFSAAHTPARGARELFALSNAGQCELISSQHAIFEAQRNLRLKSPIGSESFGQLLEAIHRVPDADPGLVAWAALLSLPGNDAPILAAAVAARADLLVTGDRKHFGHLYGMVIGPVRVVTLAKALETVVDS